MGKFTVVEKGMAEMTKVFQCPECNGHVAFDASYILQVEPEEVMCPYCKNAFALEEESREEKEKDFMELRSHYASLYEEFENYRPDELDEDEGGEAIEAFKPVTQEEYKQAIRGLTAYLWEWFPDTIDKEEKSELEELLNSSSQYE